MSGLGKSRPLFLIFSIKIYFSIPITVCDRAVSDSLCPLPYRAKVSLERNEHID
jgi:hypothetical protein